VSYVSTDIGDMALGGANVVYGDNDSLRARLGLRTGSQMWRRPGFRAEASLTASVWQEFLAKNGVQIVSAGPDLITTDEFNKTFFEVSGAVDFIDLGGGFSGHVKGDFRFADGGQFWSGKVNSGVRYRW
jgi:outer membrane autotransporter protein